jgi:hypothetical protein
MDSMPHREEERTGALASAIDGRLAELWTELFAIPPERWNHDIIGWFLRAAYGQGYCDALREPESGSLCRELGYAVPRRPDVAPSQLH